MSLVAAYSSKFIDRGASGIVLPSAIDMTGLESLFLFGNSSLTDSCRNWAPGKGDATPLGSPAAIAHSIILLGNSSYLSLAQTDSQDITIFSVAKISNDTGGGALLASNLATNSQQHSGTTNGVSLYCTQNTSGDNNLTLVFNRSKSSGGATVNVGAVGGANLIAASRFYAFCGRLDHTEGIRYLNNLSTGAAYTSSTDTGTIDLGGNICVGSSSASSGFGDQSEHILFASWSRKLTDAEMAALYSWAQDYCNALPSPINLVTGA